MNEHYRKLERMYFAAPNNDYYSPRLEISDGASVLTIAVHPKFFHAANAVHGSVYFKALDDSAFFAANSLVEDRFVLTTSFNIYLTRPVSTGEMRAEGRVVSSSKNLFVAESVLHNDGYEVGRGSGTFVRSRIALDDKVGYR